MKIFLILMAALGAFFWFCGAMPLFMLVVLPSSLITACLYMAMS